MQIVSNGDNMHEMSNPVSWEKIRKISPFFVIFWMSQNVIKVKYEAKL